MPPTELAETKTKPPPASVTQLSVAGMTCGNCARHVTEALQGVAGVQSAAVSLDSHQASVRWRAGAEPDVEALLQAVKEGGYGAELLDAETATHGEQTLAGWKLNLLVGVPVTAMLMLGEWVFGWGPLRWFQCSAFVLAGAVQVLAGARFYRGAWQQLKVGSSNMDTLVALGSTTAFGYSAWALLTGQGGHLYFMEAAAIITLISVGHWMESRVSVRASSALRKLLNLAPAMARLRKPDGSETEVAVAELRPGDLVLLRPGDRMAVDGRVTEGLSSVDESMLTGESVPVDKAPGSEVYAGTVNVSGRLVARVTAIGEETALAHIIAAVQRAQTSRANIQRLGDRVSGVFVPVVVLVALVAGLWWGLSPASAHHAHDALAQFLWMTHPPGSSIAAGVIIAAAVLIIACPCAMGLATPAAIMAGSNAAAERGILIRDGVALEKAGRVTTVLFDKTGTLTQGKPSVVETRVYGALPSSGASAEGTRVIELAAALAQPSSHPVSQAIARLGKGDFELVDWSEVPGSGVQANLQGSRETARFGSLRWLEELGVDLGAGRDFVKIWSQRGATLAGLALNGVLLALFAVQDTLKPGARDVLGVLERHGLRVSLVTGDNSLVAEALARELGLATTAVFAEVRPEQKAQLVARLQQQGERVAFVGDGINDAPALEQADLGIAVSRASDIAREAADIILLKSEIEAVPESLGLARATLRTIRQNLFWAFFYNCLGIPLAALGFMSPILCAGAMALSDLVVIGNALRLRRWSAGNPKPAASQQVTYRLV
jgi:Cu+-exporting ATPase